MNIVKQIPSVTCSWHIHVPIQIPSKIETIVNIYEKKTKKKVY